MSEHAASSSSFLKPSRPRNNEDGASFVRDPPSVMSAGGGLNDTDYFARPEKEQNMALAPTVLAGENRAAEYALAKLNDLSVSYLDPEMSVLSPYRRTTKAGLIRPFVTRNIGPHVYKHTYIPRIHTTDRDASVLSTNNLDNGETEEGSRLKLMQELDPTWTDDSKPKDKSILDDILGTQTDQPDPGKLAPLKDIFENLEDEDDEDGTPVSPITRKFSTSRAGSSSRRHDLFEDDDFDVASFLSERSGTSSKRFASKLAQEAYQRRLVRSAGPELSRRSDVRDEEDIFGRSNDWRDDLDSWKGSPLRKVAVNNLREGGDSKRGSDARAEASFASTRDLDTRKSDRSSRYRSVALSRPVRNDEFELDFEASPIPDTSIRARDSLAIDLDRFKYAPKRRAFQPVQDDFERSTSRAAQSSLQTSTEQYNDFTQRSFFSSGSGMITTMRDSVRAGALPPVSNAKRYKGKPYTRTEVEEPEDDIGQIAKHVMERPMATLEALRVHFANKPKPTTTQTRAANPTAPIMEESEEHFSPIPESRNEPSFRDRSRVVNFAVPSAAPIQDDLKILTRGAVFNKTTSRGHTHKRFVFVSPDYRTVFWTPPESRFTSPEARSMSLVNAHLLVGQQTVPFQRRNEFHSSDRCFSIVSQHRSLDLEILHPEDPNSPHWREDVEQHRNEWVEAFRKAIARASARQ